MLPMSYSSDNPSVATVSDNMVTILSAGTAQITATQAGNAIYRPARPVTRTLTVGKAAQTITFSELPPKTFGDSLFALEATSSSGLPVSYSSGNTSVAQVNGSTLTIVGAGNTVITASQASNSNYLAAADVPQTVIVNKAAAAVTLGNLNHIYNGSPKSANVVTTPPGLAVVLTYNGSVTLPINAGSYPVVATVTTRITRAAPTARC